MSAVSKLRNDTKPADMSDAEWEARQELACAYRLFDHLGWHELIYNHISLRVPDEDGHFLINPFGLMYREVKASNLVKIDIKGNIIGDSRYPVNPAGFVVHSAVHANRPDAHCVMHTHTTAGMAVACQEDGLLFNNFTSVFFYGRLSYHDYEGITLDTDECERLARDLGQNDVMILRNHGLLTCGPTVAHAFNQLYMLQRACEVQIASQAGGAKPRLVPAEIAAKAARQAYEHHVKGGDSELLFAAMRRWMLEKDPSFLE